MDREDFVPFSVVIVWSPRKAEERCWIRAFPGIWLEGRRSKGDKAGVGNLTHSNLFLFPPTWVENAADLFVCLLSWGGFSCLQNQRTVTLAGNFQNKRRGKRKIGSIDTFHFRRALSLSIKLREPQCKRRVSIRESEQHKIPSAPCLTEAFVASGAAGARAQGTRLITPEAASRSSWVGGSVVEQQWKLPADKLVYKPGVLSFYERHWLPYFF